MPKSKESNWDKLDNTALIFPVISSESMTNVYRIAAIMTEEVDRAVLQEALNRVLPQFPVFRMRMRAGMFWYYFEDNRKAPPQVRPENSFPGAYINKSRNNQYLFRVTCYQNRINLEVFHALTDGFGGTVFLKELVYQYIRLRYPEAMEGESHRLSPDVYLDSEDSYLRNYKKPGKERKRYSQTKGVQIKGKELPADEVGIIHGYVKVDELKAAAKRYHVTINTFLVAAYIYAIYREYLRGHGSDEPISCIVPVNLRPYYESHTMKNFFAMLNAAFQPEDRDYTFEEVVQLVDADLKGKMTKENLEDIVSYNVSNETNMINRWVPLIIKNFAIKSIYEASAHSNTTTLTNIGNIVLREKYRDYVQGFYCMLSKSIGMNMKVGVVSYNGIMTITFSSTLEDTGIQKRFFQILTAEGMEVGIETNGVYGE